MFHGSRMRSSRDGDGAREDASEGSGDVDVVHDVLSTLFRVLLISTRERLIRNRSSSQPIKLLYCTEA